MAEHWLKAGTTQTPRIVAKSGIIVTLFCNNRADVTL
jgi:hypothetical protein